MIIGATGTIGREIVKALEPQHEIIPVSRSHTSLTVDLGEPASIRALFARAGLRLKRIHKTAAALCILEAVAA